MTIVVGLDRQHREVLDRVVLHPENMLPLGGRPMHNVALVDLGGERRLTEHAAGDVDETVARHTPEATGA